MKNLLIFLAFFCILFGCKKQVKPKKTDQIGQIGQIDPIVNKPCSVGFYFTRDHRLSGCCGHLDPHKPSGGAPREKPLCLHKNSSILKPKHFDLLCKEIKNFNIKQELIGTNDSVIFNISAYKKAFLTELQEARHEQFLLKLQRLLCIYKTYKGRVNDYEKIPYYKTFILQSCFGEFKYIVQNQKIVSANEACLIGETVLSVNYRYEVLDYRTVTKLPGLLLEFNLLQGETYKITGGGIIWVNGKLNAAKYTKNGERLFKFKVYN